jgi:hypothetical protein
MTPPPKKCLRILAFYYNIVKAPRAPFTRALGKIKAFKAEAYLAPVCPWHFTLAFNKKRAAPQALFTLAFNKIRATALGGFYPGPWYEKGDRPGRFLP